MGIKENLFGTEEQNRIAQENLDKQALKGSKLASFLGGDADRGMQKKMAESHSVDRIPREAMKDAFKAGEDNPKKLQKVFENAADEVYREHNRGVKPMKKGGKVKSASARADGCCLRGKTRA